MTAGGDGTSLWDIESGQELKIAPGRWEGIALSADGVGLYADDGTGTLRIYTLSTSELVAIARSRVTRSLTDEECQQYLHVAVCPAQQ